MRLGVLDAGDAAAKGCATKVQDAHQHPPTRRRRRPGDRVATLAFNTVRHVEAWYGIMGIGAVCHTLNPRLFEDDLAYIINHAQDSIILADTTFVRLLEALHPRIRGCVKHIVFLTGTCGATEWGQSYGSWVAADGDWRALFQAQAGACCGAGLPPLRACRRCLCCRR